MDPDPIGVPPDPPITDDRHAPPPIDPEGPDDLHEIRIRRQPFAAPRRWWSL